MSDIRNILRSRDEETRRAALQALRGRALQETRDLLFSAMGDESWRVRKEAVDVFVTSDPDEQAIEALLELLRNHENAGLRNSAAEAVAKLGVRAAVPLSRLSGDTDKDVRKFVIDVMGIIGSPEFVPVLLASLDDPDDNVASAAAEHLGHIGDTGSVPYLIRAVVANDSLLFRFSALAALGKMTSHVPVPDEIITLADQDILRKGVYDCLGSIGDESVSPILLQGFTSRQKSTRRAAVTSWYRIFSRSSATARQGLEESLRRMSHGQVVPTLIDQFDVHDNDLAEAVTVLLGIIGDMRGFETLLAAFASERLSGVALASLKRLGADAMEALVAMYPRVDETSRSAICTVVGELAHRAGGVLIREALHDQSPLVRKAAVSAAGRLGLTDRIPDIVALLGDADFEARNAAVACLQLLARMDRAAIQAVARQLGESEQPGQRRDAVVLHAALGDGERLSMLVKDEDPVVRQAAVAAIGKLKLSAASGALLIALVDEDPEVRIAAAEALGVIGGPDVAGPLKHALDDEDIWVRCAVLRSITRIEGAAALPLIRTVLPLAEGMLMITCLELLEQLGSREAMELVEAALESSDREMVTLAISILARQGGEWVVAHADRLSAHPNEEARAAWAGVLAGLPPQQARHFLSQAVRHELDERIRLQIEKLLEGFA
ncbi:MAG: HEAT repeat domain-containing protein [Deltaproteobacteria bacterium]|nr:HEAT repeat domain-containing protein [Deltaproteobacteria bacterium]